jgi:calcium/calmodulin-dependent protein kinase I
VCGTYTTEFLTKQEDVYIKWKNAISKWCIQTDFHTKFKVIKKLGEGQFAEVYKAQNLENLQKYAIKQFVKPDSGKGFTRDILKLEITLMHELSAVPHKNICNLHEIHETKNCIYLVMDL